MLRVSLMMALLLGSCSLSHPSGTGEISNFKSGLICQYPNNNGKVKRDSKVCFETETVKITGQSSCVFDQKTYPCTWHGYSFDYSDNLAGESLSCVWKSQKPIIDGNPEGTDGVQRTENVFTLLLDADNRHFYNPLYSLLNDSNTGTNTDIHETVCSYEGAEMFRYKVKLIYPEIRK